MRNLLNTLRFRDNLLVQFSVVSFVIMVILALVIAFVFVEVLNRNIGLLEDHTAALQAGEVVEESSPFSLKSIGSQASNLKWVTLAAIGGAFIYLYATLVYIVWEGWRTIASQRSMLQSANAELEGRVVEVARERSTLEAIQGSMREGLIVLDREGRVAYSNDSANDLLGLSPADIQGRSIADAVRATKVEFKEPDAADAIAALAQADGGASGSLTVTISTPQRRYVEMASFPIPTGSGNSMAGLLARDVTEARALQDRRDAFVSIASHELRTPMTSIMGFSELLKNNTEAPEASRRDWLERIYQNSQVLAAIVEDMLNVSRIQSGRLEINIEELQLARIVEEIVESIRPDATDKHNFITEIPSDIPPVFADRDKLAQIVRNLVSNALKYSPNGGDLTIRATAESEKDRVVVEVKDEGMGIAPEHMATLFSSFMRIRRPETEAIRGTGLGLSIVRGLAGMLRGEVWVETELDKGSSFFFTVPTIKEDSEASLDQGAMPAI